MKEICNINDCTGCSVCVHVCPKQCILMIRNTEGFDYPEIDTNRCIDCKLCQKFCPVLKGNHSSTSNEPTVYASWSLDETIRRSSSSGGLFSEFAITILKNGGVVAGAGFTETMQLKHRLIDSIEELNLLKGSKYVQSDLNTIYVDIKRELRQGKTVLFTGVPCQVAGLYTFLDNDAINRLITIDLVCHGVPSPGLFKKYLTGLERGTQSNISDFSFRQEDGWDIIPSIKIDDKKQKLKGSENVYAQAFLKGYLHRESCYRCNYACFPRVGDITLADFWGIGTTIPFHHNTDKGVSLLLINTSKGRTLLTETQDNLFLELRTLQEAIAFNEQLTKPSRRPSQRDSIYSDFDRLSWKQLQKKYCIQRTWIQKVKTKLHILSKAIHHAVNSKN